MSINRIHKTLFLVLAFLGLSLTVYSRPISADSLYGVVDVSVCNLRAEGKFTSGMVSQALLGMPVKVLDFKEWYHIQTPDDYTGWVHRLVIRPMNKRAYDEWNLSDKIVVTAHYGFAYQQPNESSVPVSDVVAGNRLKWLGTVGHYYKVGYPDGREAYISRLIAQPEKTWRAGIRQDAASLISTAYSMLGIPYLWAGTSSKGVDCSGFVRTVLFMHDLIIPRDASEQALIGQRLEFGEKEENLLPGDLVFFGRPATDNQKASVSHVGIYLGNRRFIHSLGDVHVNSFSPDEADYDAYNTHRRLFAVRFLPYINKVKEIQTTDKNPYYRP
ncbi:MAG: peptidase [Bacteroidia bacterium]|nr:peptidase [Bacteroidia bacterium]